MAASARLRWCPHLRLKTRSLMILVLAIGGGLGWVANEAHVQRAAVAAITRAGGRAWYEWEFQNGRPLPNRSPPGPRWLRDHLGVDFLSTVVHVELGPNDPDIVLAHVRQLDRLEGLNARAAVRASSITDAGLAHLARLTNLRSLSLSNTRVTDEGLAHLKGMTKLEQLFVGDTAVTDRGLTHVQTLKRLKRLFVGGSSVTVPGAAKFRHAMPNLEEVSFGR